MIFELICLFVGYYLLYSFYLKRKDLPPGPTPLPILGNLLSIDNNQIEPALKNWTKKYGDIYTIWYGHVPVVLLNDLKTIIETFQKDGEAYSGRFYTKGFAYLTNGYGGVTFSDGPLWREHRRFALRVFRDFGLGKNLMQERILAVVESLIDDVKNDVKNGKNIVSLLDDIDRGVGSVITLLMFGYRFSRDENENFRTYKNLNQKILEHLVGFRWRVVDEAKKDADELAKFYYDEINKHRANIDFDSHEEPTDYVDAYLREQHKLEKTGENQHTFT
uniref:Cytochrome P450 n=1 Tax=Panagrolaimus sp. JU765 TaxID=591449 RepID=A0AC34R4L1_9BILA